MRTMQRYLKLAGFWAFASAFALFAGEEPAIVSDIKITSPHIEDVSSIEAWKKSFIKPGMTEEQSALAVWTTMVKYRHQDNPPVEYIHGEGTVRDAIKTFNVYGYSMCDGASSGIEQLARYAGLNARGKGISSHSVPEVQWGGDWHLLDSSLVTYFYDDGGQIASVDEIIASVTDWTSKNPEYKDNDKKQREFMRAEGWKKGPKVLATCKFYDTNGWLPAATHGWYASIGEYNGKNNFVYEYGYSQGYRVNVQLREGEVLTRNWFNKGLHVNMDFGGAPGSLTAKPGEGDMRYAPDYGDIAPGRVGNGTVVYAPPLGKKSFARAALVYDNLAATEEDKKQPALHLKSAGKPGILEIRMPSSYVYLGGSLVLEGVVGKNGAVKVSYSRNNGLDWKEIFAKTAEGSLKETVDLKPLIYRLYDYRLRVEIAGADTGLNNLVIAEDIQHSQRPLPALKQGANAITFNSALQEGTITIEGSVRTATKGNQLLVTEFHPTLDGVKQNDSGIWMGDTGKGSVTFPVTAPGDLTRLRFGAHYRARGDADQWEYQVSFDDGKSWTTVDKAAGPFAGMCKYVEFDKVPKGTRKALVRFAGLQKNTLGIFDLCIKADYLEPNGGFRPVQVTYVWTENGQEKKDVHKAVKPNETYTIQCATQPVMKSLIVELAK